MEEKEYNNFRIYIIGAVLWLIFSSAYSITRPSAGEAQGAYDDELWAEEHRIYNGR